jgi:hypothetical protein
MLRSPTTPTPSTKGGEKEKVRMIMEKGKVEGPTPKQQAEGAKQKEQAIDRQKEEEKAGVRTKMKTNPTNPWVNPNVVQPTKERRLNSKANATIAASSVTNLATVAKDWRPKLKPTTLTKQTTV